MSIATAPRLAEQGLPWPAALRQRLAAILAVPLVLSAVAYGLRTDVLCWSAPWALVAAGPYLGDVRLGRLVAPTALLAAVVAGPAALLGAVGGLAGGELAVRGARPSRVGPTGLVVGVVTAALVAVVS